MEAFNPYRPHNAAGIRTEPPPSLPMANGPIPDATAAAEPALDPPEVRSVFHGLRVSGKIMLWLAGLYPNSGTLVLPRMTAPAALSRSTTMSSSSGT